MTEKKKEDGSAKNDLIFLLIKIGILAVLLTVTFLFVFGICRCSGDDMSPAFRDGDLAVYYRLQKEYHPRDAVVINKNGKNRICRVAAVPGDQVDITEEGLEINGYLQQENEIFRETYPFEGGISFPVTLKKGEYFVLGDNRTKAEDSRIFGPVSKTEIKGGIMTLIRRRGL